MDFGSAVVLNGDATNNGTTITVRKVQTGWYIVTFPQLPADGSHPVQVTAVAVSGGASGLQTCGVGTFRASGPGGADLEVEVRCSNGANNPLDGYFFITVM
jgi:hypothetical protein